MHSFHTRKILLLTRMAPPKQIHNEDKGKLRRFAYHRLSDTDFVPCWVVRCTIEKVLANVRQHDSLQSQSGNVFSVGI